MDRPSIVYVGAKVELELKRELLALARENDRSASQELRRALRRHLDRERRQPVPSAA